MQLKNVFYKLMQLKFFFKNYATKGNILSIMQLKNVL